jgi:hypothetical protein
MTDHEQHSNDERRAMELVAGLACLGFAAIVGMAVAAFADQITGLDFLARALTMLRSL